MRPASWLGNRKAKITLALFITADSLAWQRQARMAVADFPVG